MNTFWLKKVKATLTVSSIVVIATSISINSYAESPMMSSYKLAADKYFRTLQTNIIPEQVQSSYANWLTWQRLLLESGDKQLNTLTESELACWFPAISEQTSTGSNDGGWNYFMDNCAGLSLDKIKQARSY